MPELERKSTLLEVKDLDAKQGIFTGFFSSFGVVDSYGDVVDPGAFKKNFAEWGPSGNKRIKCDYQHMPYTALLGLPFVLEERSFGAYHETKVSQTSYGKDVLTLIADGVLTEQSFIYEALQSIPKSKSPDGCRHLTELRTYSYGPVTWGANEQTPITGLKADDVMARMAKLDKHLKAGDLTDSALVALMNQTMEMWSKALAAMEPTPAEPKREVITVNRKPGAKAMQTSEPATLSELMEQCMTLAAQCVALMPTCFGNQEACLQCCSLCSQCCALCAKCCAMMAESGMDQTTMKQCCDLMVKCCDLCQQCCEMCPQCVTDKAVTDQCTAMMAQCVGLCSQCKDLLEGAEAAATPAQPSGLSYEEKINRVYQAVRMIERIPYSDGDGDYARYWLAETYDAFCVIEDGKTGKYFSVPWTMGTNGVVLGAMTEVVRTYSPAMKGAAVAQVMRAVMAVSAKGMEQKAGARNSAADAATLRDIHRMAKSLMDKPQQCKAMGEDLCDNMTQDDMNTVVGLVDESHKAMILAACQPAAEPGKSHSGPTTDDGKAKGPAESHPEVKGPSVDMLKRELELLEMDRP